mmetsp:Transcript_31196/g.85543  ORF Transcript_31196/g.85543 Transcript_31196/m.85543 type:complete len:264 (-) Transcript_31196:1088-1879(-)
MEGVQALRPRREFAWCPCHHMRRPPRQPPVRSWPPRRRVCRRRPFREQLARAGGGAMSRPRKRCRDFGFNQWCWPLGLLGAARRWPGAADETWPSAGQPWLVRHCRERGRDPGRGGCGGPRGTARRRRLRPRRRGAPGGWRDSARPRRAASRLDLHRAWKRSPLGEEANAVRPSRSPKRSRGNRVQVSKLCGRRRSHPRKGAGLRDIARGGTHVLGGKARRTISGLGRPRLLLLACVWLSAELLQGRIGQMLVQLGRPCCRCR